MAIFSRAKVSIAVLSALVTLTACNDDDDNRAPTDISLNNSSVNERTAGAVVGTLSATDADSGDTFTFSVDDERFEIDGSSLKLKSDVALDYDTPTGGASTVTLNVTVTDSEKATFSKKIVIDVNDVLDYYGFASKTVDGESSVSYGGQTGRHLLINDLNILINDQFGDVDTFEAAFNKGDYADRQAVIDALLNYFEVPDGVYESLAILTKTTPAAQANYVDVSSGYKNIIGKLAGNDVKGQHKNWEGTDLDDKGNPNDPANIVDGEFAGWGAKGSTTPELLVRKFFDMLADNAQTIMNGETLTDPFGNKISKLYLTEDGRDLKQLIQKFLLMGVAYSQGADDYLDNDTDNEGLLANNTDFGEKKYTKLEHKFDEGFGYFGAARDYLDYSDDEIAGKGGEGDRKTYHDANGDGMVDFSSEFNFGQSTNAAKRDRGAKVETDYTQDAMDAFLAGRKLINDAAGTALTEAQMAELVGYRDTALLAWEKAIAATVVHYINDTIADLDSIGTDNFNYSNLAKHWSEMKGFALGLQFNRLGKVSDAKFVEMHQLMGDKPADLTDANAVTAYKTDLLDARQILQDAYTFNTDNVANW